MVKMMKISKGLDKFFKIAQTLLCIGLCVALAVLLVATIANAINPDAIIGESTETVELGHYIITLTQDTELDNATMLKFAWTEVILGCIGGAAVWYALACIRKVLQPMTLGQPFDRGVGHNIRKVAWAVIALGVVENIGSFISVNFTLKNFHIENLTSIGTVTANYTIDLNFLLVFFTLMLMAYIFDYGAELQQLSDETL